MESDASESSFIPSSVSTYFEDQESGKDEMTVDDLIKSLEHKQLKRDQLQYVNGLFPQIYQQVYLNVLSVQNSNMSMWPHSPVYLPKYVDAIVKTEFNPLNPPLLDSILQNILPGDLETVIQKEKRLKDISTLLLLKMNQLHDCLTTIRKALIKDKIKTLPHVWLNRPLDSVDTLYCFLLICGYLPSKLIMLHVSRHLQLYQNHRLNPYKLIVHLTNKLIEPHHLISIHLTTLIPYLHNCLILSDVTNPQINCYESKILYYGN